MSLKDTYKFLDPNRIVIVEGSTPLYRVYQRLSERKTGALVLTESGRPIDYIKTNQLAQAIVKKADGDVDELRNLSEGGIREAIEKVAQTDILVPVDSVPVDAATDPNKLQQQADRVFEVAQEGKPVGWFLNHEDVADTAVKKTKFVCVNKHPNPDPDHGTCYSCGFPVKEVSDD